MIVAINFNMLREQAKTTEVCAKKKLGSIKRSQLGMCTLGYINMQVHCLLSSFRMASKFQCNCIYVCLFCDSVKQC